jgi:YHS domain-containing protein
MLCPFCLKEDTIKKIEEKGRIYYVCSEHAFPTIPIAYAENEKLPRDVISAIGFSGHGKTAYFASFFLSLDDLARVWPDFFTFPVNEQALDTITNNIKLLKNGKLPAPTFMNFPEPTIIQFSKMPKFKDHFLIFYDTNGENYERASKLIKNANFVTKSQTAIFFMSLHDLDYNPQEMGRLLAVYIMGLKELGGDPKQQHLLVVLTKGDLLASKLESHQKIWEYLVNGDVKNLQYSDIKSQMKEMKKISELLKEFLIKDIGASMFIHLGKANFRTVEICIISALGAAPKGDQLDISATPKRIFDPILWVMNNSTGLIPFFFKVTNSLSNFVKKSRTSTVKETGVKTPFEEKKPINYRNVAKYGVAILIFALITLFVINPDIVPIPSLTGFNPPQTSIVTPTPGNDIVAKDLAIRSYGDFLQEGQTNTYYFDISPENATNNKNIKVVAQVTPGNVITSAVGINYVPSIENKKFDYISSLSADRFYAVIDIDNPKPGRYFVIVNGVKGSGDTRVTRYLF